MLRLAIISACLFVFLQQTHAQQSSIQLTVLDAVSRMPLSYTHVTYYTPTMTSKKIAVSNENGVVVLPYADSLDIRITYIGYKTLQQKIYGKNTVEIFLKPENISLNEFVITAQHAAKPQQENVYSINSIDAEKIQSKGATTLNEALNHEMNVRFSYRPSFGSNLNMQGLSGEQVNLMIDGVPVVGRLNGNIDLQQVNVNQVDRMEVLNGPVSVVYGNSSAGGVINLISAKPTKPFTLKSTSYYESVGQYNTSVSTSLTQKKHTFMVSGGRNFFGGYSPIDTSRHKLWLQREQYLADAGYILTLKKTEIRASVGYFNELMKDRGALRAPYYKTAFDTYYESERLSNRLHINTRISPYTKLEIASAYSYFKRSRTNFYRDMVTLEYIPLGSGSSDTNLTYEYFSRPILSYYKENNIIAWQVGAEYRHNGLLANRIEDNKAAITDYAVFVNTMIYPFKNNKLLINPGIRWMQNSVYQTPLVYAMNFNAALSEHIRLKGSAAKGFRTPGIKELYLDFFFSESIQVYGNTALNPETSTHFRMATEWNKSFEKTAWGIEGAVFYNHLTDMITTAQTGLTTWQYINVGNFYSQGVNLTLLEKSKYFDFSSGYNHTGFLLVPGMQEQLADKNFYYSPEWIVQSSVKWPKYNIQADVFYKYTGKMMSQYLAQHNLIEKSFIDDYHMLDASLRKKILKNKLTFIAGMKNILNVTNVLMQGKVYGYSTASGSETMPVSWGRTMFVSCIIDF